MDIPTSEDGAGLICIERHRQVAENQIEESEEQKIKELTKAGALIAAEIDRLLRQIDSR